MSKLTTSFNSLMALVFGVGLNAAASSDKITGQAEKPSQTQQCVILLHGLGRTAGSMGKIEAVLLQKKYRVHNESYPSTSDEIDILALDVIGKGLRNCQQDEFEAIHFVTHSMGGILVRAYLQQHQIPKLGKIVMISPPNHGSEIIDMLGDYSLFQWIMGPAALQLGTQDESIINKQLKPVVGEIGIIAGNSTSDPWFSPFIPGDDDGKVSVESAKLAEMTDFIVLNNGHTFIMRSEEVIEQVLYFLANARFRHRAK